MFVFLLCSLSLLRALWRPSCPCVCGCHLLAPHVRQQWRTSAPAFAQGESGVCHVCMCSDAFSGSGKIRFFCISIGHTVLLLIALSQTLSLLSFCFSFCISCITLQCGRRTGGQRRERILSITRCSSLPGLSLTQTRCRSVPDILFLRVNPGGKPYLSRFLNVLSPVRCSALQCGRRTRHWREAYSEWSAV